MFHRPHIRSYAVVFASLSALFAATAIANSPPDQARPADQTKKALEAARSLRGKAKDAVDQAHSAREQARDARALARDARDQARDAREEARDAHHEAHELRKDAHETRRELRKDQLDKLTLRLREHEKNRQERRDKYRELAQKRWGDIVQQAPVRAELAKHAWRVARLTRMLDLAEVLDDKTLLTRIEALIKREDERHEKRMVALKEHPAPSDSSDTSSLPAAAHSVPTDSSGSSPIPTPAPTGSAQ